ncbi:MAG: TatD family hydrolase [Acidobacteria bacterium]|nr:TatD family hydrolase [Acidobacteriota bacterium]
MGEEVLDEARAAGVGRFITVGTDPVTSRAAIATAGRHDDVWATAGVHPHYAATADLEAIEALLAQPRVVAVGECGLDYHYDHSPRDAQAEVFAAQIRLAHRHDLALVIHAREAWDDTFAILDAEGVPPRTVFHCFTGGPGEAELALDRGAVLSFSGIVSFPTAGDVRAAAARCPLDRIMVETDSPYLAPVPHRGKKNRPAWLPAVGDALAAASGVSPGEMQLATTRTAERVFRIG